MKISDLRHSLSAIQFFPVIHSIPEYTFVFKLLEHTLMCSDVLGKNLLDMLIRELIEFSAEQIFSWL